MPQSDQNSSMGRTLGPILKTILFTLMVPGTVAILVPRWLLGRFRSPQNRPLTWLGAAVFVVGATIYFRCAWEFAVRGLGTPAPIAPTKFLVTTALHRYMRNPMYVGFAAGWIGLWIVFGHANPVVLAAVVAAALGVHLFVILYEEPTLRKKFGADYLEYCRNVRRWWPRLRGWDQPS